MLETLENRLKELAKMLEQTVVNHQQITGAYQECKTIYDMIKAAAEAKAKDDAENTQDTNANDANP